MSSTTENAAAREAGHMFGRALTLGLARAFGGGFWLMLLAGIVHLNITPAVPALGYWVCVPIMYLAGVVLGTLRPVRRGGSKDVPLYIATKPTEVAKVAATGARQQARRGTTRPAYDGGSAAVTDAGCSTSDGGCS